MHGAVAAAVIDEGVVEQAAVGPGGGGEFLDERGHELALKLVVLGQTAAFGFAAEGSRNRPVFGHIHSLALCHARLAAIFTGHGFNRTKCIGCRWRHGMGEAIALAFAAEGMNVAIAGRRQDKLDAVAAQSSKPMRTKTADVGDRESVRELFEWFAGEHDRLHVLVNSAGVNIPKRSMASWRRKIGTSSCASTPQAPTTACTMDCRSCARTRKGWSQHLLHRGLRASHLGGVAYNASKFAMNALGTSAAGDELPGNIRITTICPGEVDTPILDARPEPPDATHRATILKAEDIGQITVAVAKLRPARTFPN